MGGTGYGKAGLESLGMGIPTITNMNKDYVDWLPENPFVIANDKKELYEKLSMLIEDKKLREEIGVKGKVWVEKYHGFKNVNKILYQLYKENNII
jgi:spore maturation protein CgeB